MRNLKGGKEDLVVMLCSTLKPNVKLLQQELALQQKRQEQFEAQMLQQQQHLQQQALQQQQQFNLQQQQMQQTHFNTCFIAESF